MIPESEVSRLREMAKELSHLELTEDSLLKALQEAYQRGREDGIRTSAQTIIDGKFDYADIYASEILFLLSNPQPKTDEGTLLDTGKEK